MRQNIEGPQNANPKCTCWFNFIVRFYRQSPCVTCSVLLYCTFLSLTQTKPLFTFINVLKSFWTFFNSFPFDIYFVDKYKSLKGKIWEFPRVIALHYLFHAEIVHRKKVKLNPITSKLFFVVWCQLWCLEKKTSLSSINRECLQPGNTSSCERVMMRNKQRDLQPESRERKRNK